MPDHDPEYAGGCLLEAHRANIVSTELTEQTLKSDWNKTGEFTRKYLPAYPNLPLVLPTKSYKNNFELERGAIQASISGLPTTPTTSSFIFPKRKCSTRARF